MSYILNAIMAAATVSAGTLLYMEVRRNHELVANLADMEKALKVSRDIKHQQNNLFQSIIFYLESEQWDSASEFIDEILIKTAEFNKNNFLQLIKIKNCNMRAAISKIMEICDKNAINLDLIVTWDADHKHIHESAVYSVIDTFFNNIFEQVMRSRDKEIEIEVCSHCQGFSVVFSSIFEAAQEACVNNTGLPSCNNLKQKIKQAAVKVMFGLSKNIIFNSYVDNDCFRQEIMVFKSH